MTTTVVTSGDITVYTSLSSDNPTTQTITEENAVVTTSSLQFMTTQTEDGTTLPSITHGILSSEHPPLDNMTAVQNGRSPQGGNALQILKYFLFYTILST